ncbi:paired amphipathic helix protein Sin3-like 4 [Iris pallida]|uniref:Paired amphipathic helix protein Sin3-like 4 n=1 Tax=Iris pallida TaxID=29817 RepID=A0AAX6I7F4_IRIPA|nr:paired amphipathic helix protein Sin3-like 4 [Iris pallida]
MVVLDAHQVFAKKLQAMASSTSSPDDNKKEMKTRIASSTNQEHLAYVKSYLKAVRGVFQCYGEQTKFDEFIKLLVDYLNRRIGIKRLVKGASELLECYPVLILGFNSFLPKR